MRRIIEMARKYEQMRPYVEQLPDIFDRQGEEIYHLRNTIKVFQAPNGMLINVKRFHVPALPNRLVYSLGVRKPKGRRAFVYPDMLLSHGIRTPEPVALIEERGLWQLVNDTYLACKRELEKPKEQMQNCVRAVYEPFTVDEINQKIVEMLCPADMQAPIELVFQSIEGLHEACPNHPGDWYFTGHYPTPGGNKLVNQAFINYVEQKLKREQ